MTSARRNGIAWHPDGGSLLAVPGLENDVSLFERLSWSVALSLKGPHSAAVNLVSFSPNGKVQTTPAARLRPKFVDSQRHMTHSVCLTSPKQQLQAAALAEPSNAVPAPYGQGVKAAALLLVSRAASNLPSSALLHHIEQCIGCQGSCC